MKGRERISMTRGGGEPVCEDGHTFAKGMLEVAVKAPHCMCKIQKRLIVDHRSVAKPQVKVHDEYDTYSNGTSLPAGNS